MLLGLHIFNQLPKKHHFQLFTQVALIFTGENSWQWKRCTLISKSNPPLHSVRCSHSCCRRKCSISQSGSMRGSQGPKSWAAPEQTPVLRRALLIAACGCARSRFQIKHPLKQYWLKTLPSLLLALNTSIPSFQRFSNLMYRRQHIPLPSKTSNKDFAPQAATGTQKWSATVFICQPALTISLTTPRARSLCLKKVVPKSSGGSWGLRGQGGEVEGPALSSRWDARL